MTRRKRRRKREVAAALWDGWSLAEKPELDDVQETERVLAAIVAAAEGRVATWEPI